MFIQIFIAAYLAPLSQYKARDIIRNSNVDFLANLINEGKFINAVSGLTIFIEKKEQGEFSNIFIDDSSKGFSRMTYARTGKLLNDDENKKFLLFDGKVINIDDNRTNTFKFNQINFGLESYASNSIIKPKIQETDSSRLIECLNSFRNNNQGYEKELFRCNQSSIDAVFKEIYKRLILPFYIILAAFVGGCLVIKSKTQINFSRFKSIIFLLGFVLIVFSEGSSSFLNYFSLDKSFVVIIPFLLITLIYLTILIKKKN